MPSSSIAKETLLFLFHQDIYGQVEFSKSHTRPKPGTKIHKGGAFEGFPLRDMPLVAAAIIRRIGDILHKHPQKKYTEQGVSNLKTKRNESSTGKLRRRFLNAGVLVLMISSMAACAPQAPIVKEVPGATEQVADSGEGFVNNTDAGKEIDLETATAEPSPTYTETPKVNQVNQLLEGYLAGGEIDTSDLDSEEFSEFSSKLAEERNAERGISVVIFDKGDGHPAYIDNYLDMRPYDGHPDREEVIDMFLAVEGFDEEGNIQVRQDGKVITIANSAGVDWNAVITDPNDPSINWPTGEAGKDIFYNMTNDALNMTLKPTVLLGNDIHEVFIENHGMKNSFIVFTAEETDANGVPILLRKTIAMTGGIADVFEEGTDKAEEQRNQPIMSSNGVYYIGFYPDQEIVYGLLLNPNSTMTHYQGIIPTDEVTSVLTYQKKEQENMAIVAVSKFIKRTGK